MTKSIIIRKLLTLSRGLDILLMLAMGLLSGLTGIGLMGAAAWLISYAALQPPLYALTVGITCVRFFGLSRAVFRYLTRLTSHKLAFACYEKLQQMVYSTMCRTLPLGRGTAKQGQYLQQMSVDAETLRDFYLRWLLPVASTGLLTLCLALWLQGISPIAAGLLCFLWGIHVILPSILWKSINTESLDQNYRELLLDVSAGRDELLMAGTLPKYNSRMDNVAHGYGLGVNKQQFHEEWLNTLLDLCRQGALILFFLLLVHSLTSGSMEPRWLPVWLLLVLGLNGELGALSSAAAQLQHAITAAQRLFNVSQEEQGAQALSEDMPADHSNKTDNAAPILRAHNITFEYSAGVPVFAPLSFELMPGDALAIRGDSGSGKTTLAQLLLKFWPVTSGELQLMGRTYKQWSTADLRQSFAASIQPCHIFADSIRNNFMYLHPHITEAEIWQALEIAQLAELVRQFPLQLDEPLGENGSRLSGGQRNRLLTALALASSAPILILDEPTDGLDKKTASQLLEGILSHTQQTHKTLLVITHDEEAAAQLPRALWLV